ncbi:MAG: hypothetical protein BWY88_01435 [Synergistetes bacterium ADurb.Bin520]|nr:MAG: hypothetical protein BWY88_01435 [Synergistetes bacterium ADurb.Bin520]
MELARSPPFVSSPRSPLRGAFRRGSKRGGARWGTGGMFSLDRRELCLWGCPPHLGRTECFWPGGAPPDPPPGGRDEPSGPGASGVFPGGPRPGGRRYPLGPFHRREGDATPRRFGGSPSGLGRRHRGVYGHPFCPGPTGALRGLCPPHVKPGWCGLPPGPVGGSRRGPQRGSAVQVRLSQKPHRHRHPGPPPGCGRVPRSLRPGGGFFRDGPGQRH